MPNPPNVVTVFPPNAQDPTFFENVIASLNAANAAAAGLNTASQANAASAAASANTASNAASAVQAAIASYNAIVVTGALIVGNNLSDLLDPVAARGNLGLGSMATQAAGSFVPAVRAVATSGGISGGGALSSDLSLSLSPIASGTLLANTTGAAAGPVATTPSALLDVIGTTRGSLSFRGASGWSILPPDVAGTVLTSNGPGSDPTYQVPPASGLSYSGAQSLTVVQQNQAQANAGIYQTGGLINKFMNATMDVWQRGTGPIAVSTTGAMTADGWFVTPAGAAVSVSRIGGNYNSRYGLQVTGATGVTGLQIRQRIESYVAAALSNKRVTIQALVYNTTGASITPLLTVKTPSSSSDNYSGTDRPVSGQALQACPNNTFTVVSYTFTMSGTAYRGVEITFDFGNNFNSTSNLLYLSDLDIRATPGVPPGLNAAPPLPEMRPISVELPFCRRYFQTTYGNNVAPGTAGIGGMVGAVMNSTSYGAVVSFPFEMRAAPTVQAFDNAGTSLKSSNVTPAGVYTNAYGVVTLGTASPTGFIWGTGTASGIINQMIHYTASAEI